MLGTRVLLLSENQLLSGLITANLGKRGYEVTSASGAYKDSCRWTDIDPEILLLDVEPPGRDALEAVQALEFLGWPQEIPVVALCDEMPNGNGVAVRKSVRWVVKPFEVEVLLSTVRQALGDVKALAEDSLLMGVKSSGGNVPEVPAM